MRIPLFPRYPWYPLAVFLLFSCSPALLAQDLIDSEFLRQMSLEELRDRYGFFPQFAVNLYKVTYTTEDVFGEPEVASGLIATPDLPDGILPRLCYQHGTVGSKDDVPSQLRGGYQIAEVFASLGYFSVAPDFLGLGESGGVHPYVHADSEAWAAEDMLRAAREFAEAEEIQLNDQLFITGYSQGGHAAAALQRALQEEDDEAYQVTASTLMAGPYSISGVMRDLMLSDQEYFFPAYVPNSLLSYDYVYGLFNELEAVFKPKFANMVALYQEEEIDLFALNTMLINELISDYGSSVPRYMLQDSVVEHVREDLQHPLNKALRLNDVYDWAPAVPTRLFHCEGDDQVPFANAVVAEAAMLERGAPDLELVVLDADDPLDHFNCVEPAVLQAVIFFGAYQELVITDLEKVPGLQLKISPNPARDRLFIEGLPEKAEMALYDLAGRPVLFQAVSGMTSELALPELAPGMYILQVLSPEGNFSGKIVVSP